MAKKKASKKSPDIKTQGEFSRNLAELVSDFTGSHHGEAEAIFAGSSLLDSRVKYHIPTGCPNVDAMLGGGLPGGRVLQVLGNESTGKSTLLYSAGVNCQRLGGIFIVFDPECSFDPDRFRRMGGDPDKCIIIQKSYGNVVRKNAGKEKEDDGKKKKKEKKEGKNRVLPAMSVQDVFKYIRDILNNIAVKPYWQDKPILVGLDSLDNITTDEMLNGEGSGMSAKPRLIREGFRDITTPVAKSGACFYIISQIIESLSPYGSKTQTSGGGGPRFISSLRLHTKSAYFEKADAYTKSGEEKTGQLLIQVEAIKNKLNRPYMKAICAINNDSSVAYEGVDPDFSLLYGMYDKIVVTKAGSSFKYLRVSPVDIKTGEVIENISNYIDEAKLSTNPEDYPFHPSKWRDFLRENPLIKGYLLLLAQQEFYRPGVYTPVEKFLAESKEDAITEVSEVLEVTETEELPQETIEDEEVSKD